MPIIIGGCGGSGTSLLRQVLNRHSKIYIAPETHVFAKNRIYRDWDSARGQLTKRSVFGLRTSGLTMFTGFDLKHSDFTSANPLDNKENDFTEVVEQLFSKPMNAKGKVIWGEKTPNNAYHFPDILRTLPNSKCIMMVRNPYDNITSLINRKYSISHAVSRYLLTNAFGLRVQDTQRLIILKYEDLVKSPQRTLHTLMDQLGLGYEDKMLHPGKASPDDGTHMGGWLLDESEAIQPTAVHRFDTNSIDLKAKIKRAVYKLRIRQDLMEKFSLARNVKSISKKLKYDYLGMGELRDDCKWMSKELSIIKLNRSIRGYGQPFNQFPIVIR